MVKTLAIENLRKVKKLSQRVAEKLDVNITFKGEEAIIRGKEEPEFIAEKAIEAVDFGFDVRDALLLKKEGFSLEFVDISEHTNRKNLKEIRARLIGTNGKARKTIENLTGAALVIGKGKVGIIADSENMEAASQGVISLIQGAKHGNVFSYLEKQNAEKFRNEDLGLKESVLKKEQEG